MVFAYTPAEYRKRLRRLEVEINKQSMRAVKNAAHWTAIKAASLAPKDTGTLINNIMFITAGRGNSAEGQVYQFDPSYQNPSRTGKHYNYAEAMMPNLKGRKTKFNSWLNQAVRKNGADPDYLRTAAEAQRVQFGRNVRIYMAEAINKSK